MPFSKRRESVQNCSGEGLLTALAGWGKNLNPNQQGKEHKADGHEQDLNSPYLSLQ
jgi:hypothetical protein